MIGRTSKFQQQHNTMHLSQIIVVSWLLPELLCYAAAGRRLLMLWVYRRVGRCRAALPSTLHQCWPTEATNFISLRDSKTMKRALQINCRRVFSSSSAPSPPVPSTSTFSTEIYEHIPKAKDGEVKDHHMLNISSSLSCSFLLYLIWTLTMYLIA